MRIPLLVQISKNILHENIMRKLENVIMVKNRRQFCLHDLLQRFLLKL